MEDEEIIRNQTFNTLAGLPKEVLEVIGICADITLQVRKFQPKDNPLALLLFTHNVQWLSRLITEMDPERPRGQLLINMMTVRPPDDKYYVTLWDYVTLRRKILMYNRANNKPEERLVEDGDGLTGIPLLDLFNTVDAWFKSLTIEQKRKALEEEAVI